MSTYDSYDVVEEPRRDKHRHHRDRDEPRYQEVRETYVSAPYAPEPPYTSQRTEIVRRPAREDSDLSVEEVQRQFPPPAGTYVQSRSMVRTDRDRYGAVVRSRSADRGDRGDRGSQYGTYLGDPRDDRHSRRRSVVKEEVIERRRSLSRNQKIIAGVAGAALAVGGKELWDRREAANNGGHAKERNFLGTAAVGAAGAFAGYEATELYQKQIAKKDKKGTYVAVQDRHGNAAEAYYSDSDDDKGKSSKRKSIIEGALGLAGLGAAAKAASGGKDRDGKRSRRGSSSDSSRSRRSRGGKGGRGGDGEGLAKVQQAAKAALLAGAMEAFRVRNEPGGWGGAKGKRILTAAIGAGGIDAAADHDPDKHSKRHVLEAVIGGLAGNRIVNGSRKEIDDDGRSIKGGRSRSRSRAPSIGGGAGTGLAALATAGLGALAGKKLLDRERSRSRGDGDRGDRRRRQSSSDSENDRGERRNRRSKSVSDYARKGLAALGIGEAAESARDDRRGSTREVDETRVVQKGRRRGSSDDDYDDRRSSGRKSRNVYGDERNADSRSSVGGDRRRRKDKDSEGGREKRVAKGQQAASDSDSLGSSSGDERRVKKMKGKQLLTSGLAAVATIHAAHNVYQSVEKRNARHKAVADGELSPEEAKKLKMKARLQDAASIGIAALGIKGAYSEWKEMNELRHEYKELEEKKEERHQKRVERLKGMKDKGDGADGRSRRRRSDPRIASAPDLSYDSRYPSGPVYVDANPYAPGLPAPPLGYTYADRR